MSSQELARHRSHTIGIVFQAFNLLPRMTLEENVELPLRLARWNARESAARVHEAVDRVRLARAAHASSQRAFRRRAAASGAGPRSGQSSDDSAGRRADRQPRQRDRRRNHESAARNQRVAAHDHRDGDARAATRRAIRASNDPDERRQTGERRMAGERVEISRSGRTRVRAIFARPCCAIR